MPGGGSITAASPDKGLSNKYVTLFGPITGANLPADVTLTTPGNVFSECSIFCTSRKFCLKLGAVQYLRDEGGGGSIENFENRHACVTGG